MKKELLKAITYHSKHSNEKWSDIIKQLQEYIIDFENGVDTSDDIYNAAHISALGLKLLDFYNHNQINDDRNHFYLNIPKIGLDIDEVIADWVGHWVKHHGYKNVPEWWNFDKNIGEKFNLLQDNKDFWLSIPPKINPKDIPFEPHCYITSRSIPQQWTEEWIENNGFPTVPVYSVPFNESKIDVAKKSGIEVFIDDRFKNFVELNKNGICCYLLTAPHNIRYEVGYKRIKNIKDILTKIH